MPEALGSSVDVISSALAQRRQRMMATCTAGRRESTLCLEDELPEEDDERSESDAEYDDEDAREP